MSHVFRRPAARWSLMPLVVTAGLGFPACNPAGASGGQPVTVQASEFRFDAATVNATAGSPVRLTLRNTGTQVHD